MNDPFGVEQVSKAVTYDKKKGKKGALKGALAGGTFGTGVAAGSNLTAAAASRMPGSNIYGKYSAIAAGVPIAGGALIGAGAGSLKGIKRKKVAKAFTLNRKEAKKDALNVGATGAATGGALGALSSKEPLYRMKKGRLVPSKFPRGAGKGAAALGALGAASGVAANVGYKKKKK
jgi:hypothetical protein